MLNHAKGTAGIISAERGDRQLRIRLPDVGHVLKVWFKESRDFLVSVCILRKAGFLIQDGSLLPEAKKTTQQDPKVQRRHKVGNVGQQTTLSSITPLSTLAAEAEAFVRQPSEPRQSVHTSDQRKATVFDEVLDRLANRSGPPENPAMNTVNAPRGDLAGYSLLNPYNVISAAGKILMNRPDVSSPLKNVVPQDDDVRSKSEHRQIPGHPAHARRRHNYFTRSFSASNYRPKHNDKDHHCEKSLAASDETAMSRNAETTNRASLTPSKSFGASPPVDFRHLMPQRRKLPFPSSPRQREKKRSKPDGVCMAKEAVDQSADLNCVDPESAASHRQNTGDMAVILPQSSALESLDSRTSATFDRFEKAMLESSDQEECAASYLNILHRERIDFWVEKLIEAQKLHHDGFLVS